MHVFKIIFGFLAVILAGPLLFAAYYSVQAGCLLCMQGEMAGSAAETLLNFSFAACVIISAVAFLWGRLRKRQIDD